MADVDKTAYNIVPPNSFAYNPARINVGSIGYYAGTENVIVSSLYEVFQTADYVEDGFLWHWFKSTHFPKWIERLQEGSVRLYFYYDKLIQCEMKMPSLEEQKKIGKYFDNLDHLITLHQRKPIPHPDHPTIHTKHKGEEKYVRIRVNDRGKINRTANLRRFPVDIPGGFKDGGGSVGEFQIYSGAE